MSNLRLNLLTEKPAMLNGKNLIICRRLKKRVENKTVITAIPQCYLSEVGKSTAQQLSEIKALKQGYKIKNNVPALQNQRISNLHKVKSRQRISCKKSQLFQPNAQTEAKNEISEIELLSVAFQHALEEVSATEAEELSEVEEVNYIRPDSAVADLDKKQEPVESPLTALDTNAVLQEIDAAINLLEKQLQITAAAIKMNEHDNEQFLNDNIKKNGNNPSPADNEYSDDELLDAIPKQDPIIPHVDPLEVQKTMVEGLNHRRLSTDSIFSSVTTSSITTSVSKVNPIVEEIKYGISCISYNVPNFVNLNVTMCFLSMDQQITLSNAISTNTHLKHLTVSFAGVQTKAGVMFARALMKNQSIETVDFQGNSLGNQAILEFAHLLSCNHSIESLNLGNQKNVSPIGLDTEYAFVESLKTNRKIKKLHLTIRNGSYRNSIEKSLMDNSFHSKE
ncbi:hypothetical protein HDV06_002420 [Boothiomyces sp. JEL0866]|nr:hypothetical protein HDV06_002420 [Boothiomyces sp. JEL0866]